MSNKTKLLYKIYKQAFEEAVSGWITAKSKQWVTKYSKILKGNVCMELTVKSVHLYAAICHPVELAVAACLHGRRRSSVCLVFIPPASADYQSLRCNLESAFKLIIISHNWHSNSLATQQIVAHANHGHRLVLSFLLLWNSVTYTSFISQRSWPMFVSENEQWNIIHIELNWFNERMHTFQRSSDKSSFANI